MDHPWQEGLGGVSESWWSASCHQLSLAQPLQSSKEGWGTPCEIKMQSGGCIKIKEFVSGFAAVAS